MLKDRKRSRYILVNSDETMTYTICDDPEEAERFHTQWIPETPAKIIREDLTSKFSEFKALEGRESNI